MTNPHLNDDDLPDRSGESIEALLGSVRPAPLPAGLADRIADELAEKTDRVRSTSPASSLWRRAAATAAAVAAVIVCAALVGRLHDAGGEGDRAPERTLARDAEADAPSRARVSPPAGTPPIETTSAGRDVADRQAAPPVASLVSYRSAWRQSAARFDALIEADADRLLPYVPSQRVR